MKAAITADIINSIKSSSNSWIVELKKALKKYVSKRNNQNNFICIKYHLQFFQPAMAFSFQKNNSIKTN